MWLLLDLWLIALSGVAAVLHILGGDTVFIDSLICPLVFRNCSTAGFILCCARAIGAAFHGMHAAGSGVRGAWQVTVCACGSSSTVGPQIIVAVGHNCWVLEVYLLCT